MTAILITLAALAYLASGYAVNAGYFGLMEHICPGFVTGWDWVCVIANMLIPLGGAILLPLFWWEYGSQPFRWDWPWLLTNGSSADEEFDYE